MELKPIQLENKHGVFIGFVILLIGIFASIDKVNKFIVNIFSDNQFLNWKTVLFITLLTAFIVWFIMNYFWSKEYKEHETTKFERDNYKNQLKREENKRLVDIVTGVPNMKSLEQDLENYFPKKGSPEKIQFILIDIRDFRRINEEYGFIKTNRVLRMIAQKIYTTMRRNEDMYKYPMSESRDNKSWFSKFYRIHSGGDEFAFIIQGDQSDAIGFVNRLLPRFKYEFSKETLDLLGKEEVISFYAAIVEVKHLDKFDDIIDRAHQCYNLAKNSRNDFAISWYPALTEEDVQEEGWQRNNYIKAKENFDVILPAEPNT